MFRYKQLVTFLLNITKSSYSGPSFHPPAFSCGRLFFFPLRNFFFALVLALLGSGFTAAHAANVININQPCDWSGTGCIPGSEPMPSPPPPLCPSVELEIPLNDGDILNIGPDAGSPPGPTVIKIAANANVTINGNGNLISNLGLAASDADTATHMVNISNLNIAPYEGAIGPTCTSVSSHGPMQMGVVNLIGNNRIQGDYSNLGSTDVLTITSTTHGTLAVSSPLPLWYGTGVLWATTLNIEGNADVTVSGDTTTIANTISIGDYDIGGAINVATDAKLTVTGLIRSNGSLSMACDGTLIASNEGDAIIASPNSDSIRYFDINITGSGTVTATSTGNGAGIVGRSLTVNQATVNATGAGTTPWWAGISTGAGEGGLGFSTGVGPGFASSTPITVTGGGTLHLTGRSGTPGRNPGITGGPGPLATPGSVAARPGIGIVLDASGSSVTLTNYAETVEPHIFTMAAGIPAGSTWEASGSITFPSPSATATNPATFTIAASSLHSVTPPTPLHDYYYPPSSGTIKLRAPNGTNGKLFTGTVPLGTMTAVVSGGGDGCMFDPATTRMVPAGNIPAPSGTVQLRYGLFEFDLEGCDPGSQVTITTTWPNLNGITGYLKYGPTPTSHGQSVWYEPANLHITGNTISYTVTDGGLGDDDLTADGVIRDPGGPVGPKAGGSDAAAIPTLGAWALALLAAALGCMAALPLPGRRRG